MKPCACGSGLTRRAMYDAAGIFAGYVCDACEKTKRGAFRPEVLEAVSDWVRPSYDGDDDLDDEEENLEDW